MAIKDDYIKVRVSKEQKNLFTKVAELKGITMTELLVGGTEERALRELDKIEGTKNLELRVSELEKKLQGIRVKMEGKRAKKKIFYFVIRFIRKIFWDKIFYLKVEKTMKFVEKKLELFEDFRQIQIKCSSRI